jgi:DNA (cytosine-5)-methyltransferase 1
MGYHRAGFEVVGVDIRPQPHYPFRHLVADALSVLRGEVHELDPSSFDVVHASPPCQSYSPHVTSSSSPYVGTRGRDELRFISSVRAGLEELGHPYVLENVYGARGELGWPVLLCGSMFGMDTPRHRLFEVWGRPVAPPPHPRCQGMAKAAALRRGWEVRDMTVTGKGRHAGTGARWSELLGVDWPMSLHELAEAIPPAYTEWLGRVLLEELLPVEVPA